MKIIIVIIFWAISPSPSPGHLMCDYYVKSILSTLHFPNVISITWVNRTGFCSNATGPDCVLDLVRPSVLIITSAPESLFFTQTHCGWLSVATAPAFGRLWLHPLTPGNAVPRSEIITLAQHRVSRDGWDVCVILTFQLIAEHLFSHVGESAAEIMYPIL